MIDDTMRKTAIVIPCYNESHRLRIIEFKKYTEENVWVHFVFVDDGSTDDTYEILANLCRTNTNQMLHIRLSNNSGKAEAVRQGILKAMDMDFDIVGYWDADLSTPLRSIATLCEVLNSRRVQIVIGSRVKLLGRRIERLPTRHYLGRIFATFASLVLGIAVYDTQCGAKVFETTADLKKIFSRPFNVNWTFDVEILARYKLINKDIAPYIVEKSVVEYPLEEWIHVPGSKIMARDYFVGCMELIKIFLLLRVPGVSDRYLKQFMT